MRTALINKEKKLAVIGLGYVGLPLALEFASRVSVIGFDINESRIDMMKNKTDPSKEVPARDFENKDILFTTDINDLKKASFFIVTVPTPVDQHNVPDLKPLHAASLTISRVLKPGDYVVFESTVYPGCTEEDCLPILEEMSGLKLGKDFKLGYSPERINPGDKKNTLRTVIKVVSGNDEESLNEIAKVYEIIVEAGVHKARNIKVAEASKIVENTQRDLNIALMNELSIIFDQMGINTFDVLEAAGTKWNFLKFHPGLVGGHCIGVDPYYLSYKAESLGIDSKVINVSRFINDRMAHYVSRKILQHILKHTPNVAEAKVLVKGVTFKENVSDIRNSKVADVIKELKSYNIRVDIEDPHAIKEDVLLEYGFDLTSSPENDYDAVIINVPHKEFKELDSHYFESITKPHGLIADLRGVYRNKIINRKYWSL